MTLVDPAEIGTGQAFDCIKGLACPCLQVTTTIPAILDGLLAGVPTVVEVKGLQLNVSLAADPAVSKDRLVVRDWGRFQNPDGRLQVIF